MPTLMGTGESRALKVSAFWAFSAMLADANAKTVAKIKKDGPNRRDRSSGIVNPQVKNGMQVLDTKKLKFQISNLKSLLVLGSKPRSGSTDFSLVGFRL